MRIKLKNLVITNFKGVQHWEHSFDDETLIKGANETGKSTIVTAFFWLLTGKDEFDRKDYEIKNTALKELNAQSHEVEGLFEIDNEEIKLKRVYLEKWVKPKGQTQKVFEGNKTEFYFNDVPCNASEYQAKVDGIIASNLIKLLTNPYFFNTLPWEKQRSALMQIAGDITNSEVFDKITTPQNDFCTLIMVLNSRKSLEEYKSELNAKKKLLKKKQEEYTPRIDEAKRNKPEEKDWSALQKELASINKKIEKIDQKLSDAAEALKEKQSGIRILQNNVYVKQNALDKIRSGIKTDIENKAAQFQQQVKQLQTEIDAEKRIFSTLQQSLLNAQNSKRSLTQAIDAREKRIVQLRSEWDVINKEVFHFDDENCKCPTCLQQLPAENIEKQKESLLANFNQSKLKRKQEKVDESNRIKSEKADLQKQLSGLNEDTILGQITEQENKIASLENKLTNARAEVAKHSVQHIDIAVNELLKLNGDALNLQDEINSLENQITVANDALTGDNNNDDKKSEKKQLQIRATEINNELALLNVIAQTDKRIEQLLHEESENAQAIADVEKQENEIEQFTRAKNDIVQEKVNKLFRYVQFRLFQKQVNGEIAETCVCEYKGVPFPTLNTAARLLAGIDVLNTLSAYYKTWAPVFCDNRESVSWIPESKSQLISLYVSPEHKKLTIETIGKREKAVA